MILTTPTEMVEQLVACGVTPPDELLAFAHKYEIASRRGGGAAAYEPEAFGGSAGHARDQFSAASDDPEVKADDYEALMVAAAETAAVQEQLVAIFKEVGPRLKREASHVMRRNGADFVEQARPHFDQAIADLAEVVALLGVDPDLQAILDAKGKDGKEKLAAWKRRADVLRVATQAGSIRSVLAQRGYGTRQVEVTWFLNPDEGWDPQTLAKAEKVFGSINGLGDKLAALLDDGITPYLATAEESKEISERPGKLVSPPTELGEPTEEEIAYRQVDAWTKVATGAGKEAS